MIKPTLLGPAAGFFKFLFSSFLVYTLLWLLLHRIGPIEPTSSRAIPTGGGLWLLMSGFVILFFPIAYFLHSWIAGKFLKTEWKRLLLYSGVTLFLAVQAENFVDS